ncbi:uncharacterized protein VTP21DRAFT_8967 [Calcarisporiella thermophila]|uniref:uncharacterized protein n=1 Tax=Calcarisporiella thermophila TaxID=911321 RepID=UPI003743069C
MHPKTDYICGDEMKTYDDQRRVGHNTLSGGGDIQDRMVGGRYNYDLAAIAWGAAIQGYCPEEYDRMALQRVFRVIGENLDSRHCICSETEKWIECEEALKMLGVSKEWQARLRTFCEQGCSALHGMAGSDRRGTVKTTYTLACVALVLCCVLRGLEIPCDRWVHDWAEVAALSSREYLADDAFEVVWGNTIRSGNRILTCRVMALFNKWGHSYASYAAFSYVRWGVANGGPNDHHKLLNWLEQSEIHQVDVDESELKQALYRVREFGLLQDEFICEVSERVGGWPADPIAVNVARSLSGCAGCEFARKLGVPVSATIDYLTSCMSSYPGIAIEERLKVMNALLDSGFDTAATIARNFAPEDEVTTELEITADKKWPGLGSTLRDVRIISRCVGGGWTSSTRSVCGPDGPDRATLTTFAVGGAWPHQILIHFGTTKGLLNRRDVPRVDDAAICGLAHGIAGCMAKYQIMRNGASPQCAYDRNERRRAMERMIAAYRLAKQDKTMTQRAEQCWWGLTTAMWQ